MKVKCNLVYNTKEEDLPSAYNELITKLINQKIQITGNITVTEIKEIKMKNCKHNLTYLIPEEEAKKVLNLQGKEITDKNIALHILDSVAIYGPMVYCDKCNHFLDNLQSLEENRKKITKSKKFKNQIKKWMDYWTSSFSGKL